LAGFKKKKKKKKKKAHQTVTNPYPPCNSKV
jgi:hypothetical protein